MATLLERIEEIRDETRGGYNTAARVGGVLEDMLGNMAVSVKDHGAVGDGVTDDTDAIQAAITYAETLQYKSVYLPAGEYLVSDTLRVQKMNISIIGEDRSTCYLQSTGDYGDIIYFEHTTPGSILYRVGIRDITIESMQRKTSGAAIHLKNVNTCFIENIFILHSFIGMKFEGAQVVQVNSTTIKASKWYSSGGVQIAFPGSLSYDSGSRFVEFLNATIKNTEVFFTDFNWSRTEFDGIEYGLFIEACDGIWFSNGHIFGAWTLVKVLPKTSSTGLSGLLFDNVWFDDYTITDYGVVLSGESSGFANIEFNDCKCTGVNKKCFVIDTQRADPNNVSVNKGIWGNCPEEAFYIDGGYNINIHPSVILGPPTVSAGMKGVYFTTNLEGVINIQTSFIGTNAIPIPVGIDINNTSEHFMINDCAYFYCTLPINLTDHARSGGRIGIGTNVGGVNYAVVASATAITIPTTAEVIHISGTEATITAINYGWEGRLITLIPYEARMLIDHNVTGNGKIRTLNGSDKYILSGKPMTLRYSARDAAWYEISNGVTETTGTATIGSSDDPPSSTITHNCPVTPTPSQIRITPTSALGAAVHWWVSDVGATTFKINLDAVAGSSVTFEWRVVI